jgi:hypothetical protein
MNEKFTKTLRVEMINYFVDQAIKLDPTRTSDDILDIFVDGSPNFNNALACLKAKGMVKESLSPEELDAVVDRILGE